MNRAWFGTWVAATVLFPMQARAQSGDEPNLVFSITAGYTNGGRLWTLDKQAIAAPFRTIESRAVILTARIGLLESV